MELRLCPRKHARETRAARGSLLCGTCLRQLEQNLRALPGLHQGSLHDVTSTSWRINPTKVSGSRKQDHLNISVLDARHNILASLDSWAGLIVEELGTTAPARSVPQLASFLLSHLDWLTAQAPAADFADEVESLRAELLRAIDPAPAERTALTIDCVVDHCTGTIDVSPRTARTADRRSIACTAGHSWEMREWLTLRHLMGRQGKGAA